jgi:hypothetical protein
MEFWIGVVALLIVAYFAFRRPSRRSDIWIVILTLVAAFLLIFTDVLDPVKTTVARAINPPATVTTTPTSSATSTATPSWTATTVPATDTSTATATQTPMPTLTATPTTTASLPTTQGMTPQQQIIAWLQTQGMTGTLATLPGTTTGTTGTSTNLPSGGKAAWPNSPAEAATTFGPGDWELTAECCGLHRKETNTRQVINPAGYPMEGYYDTQPGRDPRQFVTTLPMEAQGVTIWKDATAPELYCAMLGQKYKGIPFNLASVNIDAVGFDKPPGCPAK